MVHLRYPSRQDFLTWDELGCLARMLGFPQNIVRENVTTDITVQEEGISLPQLEKMIELKLLHEPLHRSFNMHTADWNLSVMRKAVSLLLHNVLSFQELHNIRLAYVTYEASDMKGLRLHLRTLMRTLKMCDRVISPLKLMHRVKHMRGRLEEAGRIQLYEFFDLILWCDQATALAGAKVSSETAGQEKGIFHLVDFDNLLSHEDQRQARMLDQKYLAEEWEFGREKFGSKQMFKEEVVFSANRIKQLYENQLSDGHYGFSRRETQEQKRKYRHLKTEISQSQRRVYRAHAGSIRPRPISAPNLSMYATPRSEEISRATTAAAVYRSMQKRLHSASPRVSQQTQRLSDRPTVPEFVRVQTPRMVKPEEIDEVQRKIGNLQFDMFTLESRCQVNVEEEMEFYIPGYKKRVSCQKLSPVRSRNAEPARSAVGSPDDLSRDASRVQQAESVKLSQFPTDEQAFSGQLAARRRATTTAPATTTHLNHASKLRGTWNSGSRSKVRSQAIASAESRKPSRVTSSRCTPAEATSAESPGCCTILEDTTDKDKQARGIPCKNVSAAREVKLNRQNGISVSGTGESAWTERENDGKAKRKLGLIEEDGVEEKNHLEDVNINDGYLCSAVSAASLPLSRQSIEATTAAAKITSEESATTTVSSNVISFRSPTPSPGPTSSVDQRSETLHPLQAFNRGGDVIPLSHKSSPEAARAKALWHPTQTSLVFRELGMPGAQDAGRMEHFRLLEIIRETEDGLGEPAAASSTGWRNGVEGN